MAPRIERSRYRSTGDGDDLEVPDRHSKADAARIAAAT